MDGLLERWLGAGGDDPGCEAVFRALDRYVEAVLRGEHRLERDFAGLVAHAASCGACREDLEGLVAALRAMDSPPRARPR